MVRPTRRPTRKNWDYDEGGGGWGNNELEIYTNSPNNAFQDGQGHLVIRAIRDRRQLHIARLQTGGPGPSTSTTDLSWQYGRSKRASSFRSDRACGPPSGCWARTSVRCLARMRRGGHHGEFRDLQ